MDHRDTLESLNANVPLREKLAETHRVLNGYLPFVARVAVALYEPKTTLLKTYVQSSDTDDPLPHYQARLSETPSLQALLAEGKPRVINNMVTFEGEGHEHSRRLGRQGYAASYTMPMFSNGGFFGFVFFNSHDPDVFTDLALKQLDVFGHMISLMVINELSSVRTLLAALATTSHITHLRDPETGSHLDRMSRYARVIARALASRHALDDDYIEHIFMYSPLHDIGKIGIPDSILLKSGSLTADEAVVMRSHAARGREAIDDMLASFGLDGLQHVDILRNIVEYHHEAVDGGGYPRGLKGDRIPLEARIVAVADVFDALTSRRPYKEAWTNEDAFAALRRLARDKLDAACVAALLDNRAEIELIQRQFQENPLD